MIAKCAKDKYDKCWRQRRTKNSTLVKCRGAMLSNTNLGAAVDEEREQPLISMTLARHSKDPLENQAECSHTLIYDDETMFILNYDRHL